MTSESESNRIMATDKDYKRMALLYSVINEFDVELIGNQLNDDFPINYKIDSNIVNDYFASKTIFQMIQGDTEISQILIDHGADFTITNTKGSTILLEEITSKYNNYLDRSKLESFREDTYVNVVLSAHVKSRNTKNPRDHNGLTHFHVACMYNHTEGVSFFLKNGVSVNESVKEDSVFYPGYSALHFATKSCAVETAELLLKSDANLFAEDSKGINPLHVLVFERIKIFIALKGLSRITPSENNESHYSNLQNHHVRNKKILSLCLESIDKCGSNFLDNTTFFLIYLICTTESTRIQEFIDCNKENFAQLVNTGSQVFAGRTPVHFAALFSVEILELLVKNGANLATKDFNKVTPFDICLKGLNVVDLHRIILSHPDYSRIVFSNMKTKLSDFIYAMLEVTTFENFLRDNLTNANIFIPFDSPVCAGFTPLHLAVICTEQPLNWSWKNYDSNVDLFANFQSNESQKYLSRIDSCLYYNPDITSRDARGSTPLHWAFRFQESYVVHRLLQRHETSSDYVDEFGLSHLHIACAAKDEALVEKLLLGGANVNQVATLGYTWLDVNSLRPAYQHDEVIKYIINKGSTPLHFAATVRCPIIVRTLIHYGANVLAKDAAGMNPLERILGASIFVDERLHDQKKTFILNKDQMQIAEMLVRKVTSTLIDTKPDQIIYCLSLLQDDLLGNICQHMDEPLMRILANLGITAFHVACFTKDILQVSSLADALVDVNVRVNLNSPLWPGCTPLHLFTKYYRQQPGELYENLPINIAMVALLLQRGADVTVKNADGETPLHQFFQSTRYGQELNMLLQHLRDFSVNPTSKSGITHLHIASAMGLVSIVEKLLEQGAEINQPTDYFLRKFGGYTALHFAIAHGKKEVVDVLLKHGAHANWINTYGENALHVATKKQRMPSFELLETLFSAGVDIHIRNMFGDTPLESLIKSQLLEWKEIELFLENDRRINIFNPITGDGLLARALYQQRLLHTQIFDILIEIPTVKDIHVNGRNAIHNLVSFKRPSWDELHIGTIELKYTPSREYTRAIESLIKLSLNINHQDFKGFTPLHLAARMQNITGIIGLLENGADINITDADGKRALAYSLELAEIYEERTELDLEILEAISIHIFKLNMARIGVSKPNEEVDNRIRESYTVEESTVELFTNEVQKMMEEHVESQSFTFYDLLSDTGAVSAFPYMLPSTRTAVDNFFKNEVESLRERFPQFTGILLLQYRKALARCDIIHSAVTSLDLLLGFYIPAVCSRNLLGFLSNDDLNNLIHSTSIFDV